MIWVEKIAG